MKEGQASSPSTTSPQGVSILLVNDDEDGLFLLEHHLMRAFPGAKIFPARNGHTAMNVWNTEKVDAIVTDNRMPLITGMMLTRKIRETNSKVPIIMVTSSEVDRPEAMRAGVTIFYSESNLNGVTAALTECLKPSAP